MGIWVVILEAVATEGELAGLAIEPGALEDLAEELAANYAVVTERPGAFETELWVEEGTAGGAVLAAQRLCQAAVRFLGLPPWEVVRAEARDAHALETGIIDWPEPPAAGGVTELDPVPVETPAPEPVAPKKSTPKKGTPKQGTPKQKAARKVAPKQEVAPKQKAAPTKAPPKKAAATKAPRTKAAATKAPPKKAAATVRSRKGSVDG